MKTYEYYKKLENERALTFEEEKEKLHLANEIRPNNLKVLRSIELLKMIENFNIAMKNGKLKFKKYFWKMDEEDADQLHYSVETPKPHFRYKFEELPFSADDYREMRCRGFDTYLNF